MITSTITHRSTLKNMERLKAAAANPVLSKNGGVKIVDTLTAYHISKSAINGRKLKALLNPGTPLVRSGEGNIASMRISEKSLKKGWEKVIQHPAIYSITCLGSGKSYIGSSMRPDLRRAVHLYWLKNYWKWGTSNIFFGNTAIARDVDKYGAESFQLDIIKSYPNATSEELKKHELAYLQKHGIAKFYNRRAGGKYTDGGWGFAFIEIDPTIKQMREEFFVLLDKFNKMSAGTKAFRKEIAALRKSSYAIYKKEKAKINKLKESGQVIPQAVRVISSHEYRIREDETNKKRAIRDEEMRLLDMQITFKGKEIRERVEELKEYYGNLTEKPSVTSVK